MLRLCRSRAPASTCQKQPFDVLRRHCGAEPEALYLLASFGSHPLELLFRLHAFSSGRDAKALSKCCDRANDVLRSCTLDNVLHERPIDLDLVEREALQIAQ